VPSGSPPAQCGTESIMLEQPATASARDSAVTNFAVMAVRPVNAIPPTFPFPAHEPDSNGNSKAAMNYKNSPSQEVKARSRVRFARGSEAAGEPVDLLARLSIPQGA
jgi:hypothetical protein